MTDIKFRRSALDDLMEIKKYYADLSPLSANTVLTDIFGAIDSLIIFPAAGRKFGPAPRRRLISPKFKYVIAYAYAGDFVEIMGVFRSQDRQD